MIAEKAIFSVFPSDPSEKLSHLASKITLREWDPDPMSTRLAQKAMTTISEHQVGPDFQFARPHRRDTQ